MYELEGSGDSAPEQGPQPPPYQVRLWIAVGGQSVLEAGLACQDKRKDTFTTEGF